MKSNIGKAVWSALKAVVLGATLTVLLVATGTFAQAVPQKPTVSPEQQKQIKALTEEMMMNTIAGHHAEALKACDKLIELDPANGDYYMGRGEMLRCLGRNDEALASYEKAATTSKNPIVRQDARQGRAEILFQQGKHNEVITACTKSIELSPKDPRPWYRRAAARALMGDTANALSDLKKVFYLNPDLKKRAAKDAAFKSLCDTEKFKNLRPEAPPEDGFKLSAEWKALNRLVGDWEGQETVTVPETKQGRGLRTAKWTLGDRYLEMKWKSGLDNTDGMSLTTYDPDQQAIRCWAFSSRYAPAVLSARWDEQTKTLTYNGEDAGPITFVATDRFLDDDHREWACTIKDASGKILFASTAKITRQKK